MRARLLPLLVAIAGVGAFPSPAVAGFYSSKELFKLCTTDRDDPNYVDNSYECVAYIAGAVDAFNTTREANHLKSCIPAGVTIAQLKDATVDFLHADPDSRKGSASGAVFTATRKAWPCAKKK